MRRFVWSQLRHRPGRALALLIGILVATTSFTVLTSTSRTSQLQVVSLVRSNFRSAYDVVVRPAGSTTPLERRDGLVRGNVASGIFGGITQAQLAAVRAVPGIEVAAPVAVVGVTEQVAKVPIDVQGDLGPAARQVLKVDVTRGYANGAVQRRDNPQYLYATRSRAARLPAGATVYGGQIFGPTEMIGGRPRTICPSRVDDPSEAHPFVDAVRSNLWCWSARAGSVGDVRSIDVLGRRAQLTVPVAFTFVLMAVDPTAEAQLEGLDRTVVAGRYLGAHEGVTNAGSHVRGVPVLVASTPQSDETTTVGVSRLGPAAVRVMTSGRNGREQYRPLAAVAGGHVRQERLDTAAAYRQLVARLSRPNLFENLLTTYWTGSPVAFTAGRPDGSARRLGPTQVRNPDATWANRLGPGGMTYLPKSADGSAFRHLVAHKGQNGEDRGIIGAVILRAVGEFDPSRLAGFASLAYPGLSTYQQPQAEPADPETRRLLHGQPLRPDGNPAGYLTQPPSLITTMDALPALVDPDHYDGGAADAPVSVIRVRVAGVTGPDPLSRERIRRVAEQIGAATGLDVDITAGSSRTPVQVSLPADPATRSPALLVDEGWAKKGAALAVLRQVDRKSLLLFVLILAVCALFVANGTSAAVRTRRSELGVLACLGWSRRRLYTAVLAEVLVIGTAAGAAGSLLSVPLGRPLGLQVSTPRAALAVPAAVGLALVAGLVPAWRAARADPGAAIRPAVHTSRRARSPRGLSGLAVTNVLRTPARSALAALSLAVGTAALTLLVGITLAFRGALVGSLLGDAVTVQVRGADYLAVAATVALGVLAAADVLWLNLRERAAELATLRATGWTSSALSRLVVLEGATLGLAGALAGAAAGLAGVAVFAGALPGLLLLITAAVLAGGTAVTALAAVVPAQLLRRLPTAPLLAED